jgi:hypothetical protein
MNMIHTRTVFATTLDMMVVQIRAWEFCIGNKDFG